MPGVYLKKEMGCIIAHMDAIHVFFVTASNIHNNYSIFNSWERGAQNMSQDIFS